MLLGLGLAPKFYTKGYKKLVAYGLVNLMVNLEIYISSI